MQELVLKVDGMVCSGCENRIQNALKNIDGVKKVQASHQKKEVKVVFDKDIEEKIKSTIIKFFNFFGN